MYRNHPLYRNSGGMAHDERTIRNVDDEIYRIAPKTYDRGAMGRDARDEYGRDLREKRYLRRQMNRMANGGMPMMPPPEMGPPPGGPPMGGPPPMGPPPMADTPPLEGIEAAFAQQMSERVDNAGNTEQLIDAIRGNDKPIQARYDELSQYVGQQDAHQTPETVLALVQPTFFMTEQGLGDSGIDQHLAPIPTNGEPAMAGPPPGGPPMGGPPPMGPPPMGPPPTDQGVGALLGPGMSPPPPPPPQMMAAVGGAVKKLQGGSSATSTGGEQTGLPTAAEQAREIRRRLFGGSESETPEEEEVSRLAALFGEDYQTLKEIMAPTEQQNRLARSQLFFDAARAGLNLAANRDSQGNRLTGSTASKFAAATEPVLAKVPAASKLAQSAAADAAARQAAVTSALAQRTAEDAHERSLKTLGIQEEAALERAVITAAGRNPVAPNYMVFVGEKEGPDGNMVEDLQYLDLSTTSGRAQGDALIELGYRVRTPAQNEVALREGDESITSGELTALLSDSALLNRIANGTATPEEERRLGILLARDRQQRGDVDATTGEYVPFPDKPLPAYVRQALQARVASDEARGQEPPPWIVEALKVPDEPAEIEFFWDFDDTGAATLSEAGLAATTGDIGDLMGEPGNDVDELVSELRNVPGPTLHPTPQQLTDQTLYGQQNYKLNDLFGTSGAFRGIWDTYAPMLTFGGVLPEEKKAGAVAALRSFNTMAVLSLMEATAGRDSNQLRERLEALTPAPEAFLENDVSAKAAYVALRNDMLQALVGLETQLNPAAGGRLTGNAAQEAQGKHRMLKDRIREVSNLITVFDQKINPVSDQSYVLARQVWIENNCGEGKLYPSEHENCILPQ